jgi:hypothetical protein
MLPLAPDQKLQYDSSTSCPYCKNNYTEQNGKVRHHNHESGLFTSPCCNSCNMAKTHRFRKAAELEREKLCMIEEELGFKNVIEKEKDYYRIPVIMHNFKGYDSHFIIKNFDKQYVEQGDGKFKDIKITASNSESFISLDMNNLRFIDSCQFLKASLDTLVTNLDKGCDNHDLFIHTRRHTNGNTLLFKKGTFCYEWFDNLDKLKEKSLPSKEAFHSKLNDESISDEDYEHAQKVWNEMKCLTFKDYHDLYMKCDVLLLADVFESFRKMGMENYELDPAHFLTLPSFSWESMLKLTRVILSLITDHEMELFISSSIRGGVSTISHRHVKANNPYMEDYDESVDTTYIAYLDANNLYGFSMSQPLPYDGFMFLPNDCIDRFDYMSVPVDAPTGYILEVDIDYPDHLHDAHNDYPLAPESVLITHDMLSPFCLSFESKHVDCRKLVPNLRNKTKYVVHYRNLQLYVQLGMIVTKIHRVLQFSQKPWMKPYIDFNTTKRQNAKNDLEKDLFKLMNNACFGKTMENVRKRKTIDMVFEETKCLKLIAKPQFESFKIINENMVLVDRVKRVVILDKPMYAGFSILDLSKLLMYDFHYNVVKKHAGVDVKVCFTDTDSFLYKLKCDDYYDMVHSMSDVFDTSNYAKDFTTKSGKVLFSNKNAKVVGKFKDECGSVPALEFVGLRSKMYSVLVEKDKPSKRTAKGVKRGFVEKHVRHEMYLHTLKTHKSTRANFVAFRSRGHTVQTVNFDRVCLSAYDDKRHVLDNGIDTLAYGHYSLRK